MPCVHNTCAPAARDDASHSSADLPTPGSPRTTTTPPRPAAASANKPSSRALSKARPQSTRLRYPPPPTSFPRTDPRNYTEPSLSRAAQAESRRGSPLSRRTASMSNAEHAQSLIVVGSPSQQPVTSMRRGRLRALAGPIICGAVVGVIQAISPLGFWWLAPKTVYALGLTLIAAVYIGFSVADGRWVVIAAVSVGGSAWLLVLGLAGHGLKDVWQHRTQFVRNTRWWPPFCSTVDW